MRLLTMLGLWAVAAWHRLRVLDHAVVGSDSLGPYLQAQAALFGNFPRPPNPESGDALWLTMVPMVAAADSLVQLFSFRFALGGVVAPLGFAAAYHWTSETRSAQRRWAAALTAGIFLAFDPGLVDTLVSGARSYGAPEFVGAFTLAMALSLRGVPWAPAAGLVSLVFAIGHHPLAMGMAIALVPFLRQLHRIHGGRTLQKAAWIGALAAVPQAARLGSLAACGEGIKECLARVAQSNVGEPVAWTELMRVSLHDRFAVDFKGTAAVMIVGVGLALICRQKDHRKAGLFAIVGLIGVLGMGLANGYIRSYHLRIAAVPIAAVAAIGLARVWPLAGVASIAFVMTHMDRLPVGPDPGAMTRQDEVATTLPSGPLWVDRVWWSGQPTLDASAVVLSGWLDGRRDFQLGNATPFVLLNVGSPAKEPDIKLFATASDARTWIEEQSIAPHQTGGAYDWATVNVPNTRLEDARW